MIWLKSIGRKDDLESLFYILCFLYRGKIPVVEWINDNYSLEDSSNNNVLDKILKYRRENDRNNYLKVRDMLPVNMRSSFTYIKQLGYNEKPNYSLIKLLMATTSEEEEEVLDSAIKIDANLSRHNIFDHEEQKGEERKNDNNVNDLDSDYEFSLETDEMIGQGINSIEHGFKKINMEEQRKK